MEHQETTKSDLLIAHLGDIHLRDSQYANQARGKDFSAAFEQSIDLTTDADLLVCCGDIFDSSRPSPRVIGQLIRIDTILRTLNKTMLCITGNHDRSSPTWLSTLFQSDDNLGIVPLDGRKITIHGFTFAGIPPYTANQFRAKTGEIIELCDGADVVLYHGLVTGIVPMHVNPDSEPLTVEDMPVGPTIKAVLLGDIHIQGSVIRETRAGRQLVAYPGTLEMCSAAENPEKSVPMVRLTKESAVVEETRKLQTRPFISAKIRTAEELDGLVVKLQAAANDNPVVVVEFDRTLPDVIHRIYTAVDADKALVRCTPLPHAGAAYVRQGATENDGRTLRDFMSERFQDDLELEALALALVDRGDDDAANILSEFIESNLATA